MTSYKTFGELEIPLISSPGGLSSIDHHYTGGMYGSGMSFQPNGDYGAGEDYQHGQKGPLYQDVSPDEYLKATGGVPSLKQGFDFLNDGSTGIKDIPSDSTSSTTFGISSSTKNFLGVCLILIAAITLSFQSYYNGSRIFDMFQKIEPVAVPVSLLALGGLMLYY